MSTAKYIIAIVVSIAAGLTPAYGAFLAWSWTMDQVPKANEWAVLIKVGITVLMAPMTIWISVWLGIIACGLCVALFAAILE